MSVHRSQTRLRKGGARVPNPLPGGRANYRIEHTEAAIVVHVFDEIDIGNANMLGDALFASLQHGRPIVVDLSGLDYIDSVALHVLLRAFQRAEAARIDAVLVAKALIRQLVEQVGLDRIVPVVGDVPRAIEALQTKSGGSTRPK